MSEILDSVVDMTVPYKICIDCENPHQLAAFWAEAMEYVVEDHSRLIKALLDAGTVTEDSVTTVDGRVAWRFAAGIRDPDGPVDEYTGVGQGGRVLFQIVPERKTAKNRVHLDLHVGEAKREATVKRLTELGGTVLWHRQEFGSSWTTMADPEGNEFCVA
jgi:hypothetical protein